jgi:hypothetical protein
MILSLLAECRAALGTKAVVICEEAEDEALKEEVRRGGAESSVKGDLERSRERCRQAARRLVSRGEVPVSQGGQVIDPSFTKGITRTETSNIIN